MVGSDQSLRFDFGDPSLSLPDPVRTFVNLLRDGPTDSNGRTPTVLSAANFPQLDKWFKWLQTCANVTSLSFITNAKIIQGFQLKLTPSQNSSTSLHFTSTKFTSALVSPSKDDAFSLPGDGKNLILGLDTTSAPSMTLSEVMSFAGVSIHNHFLVRIWPADQNPLNNIKLKLDLRPGHRNAIWFEPKNSSKTVVRLQFILPVDEINSFFNKYLSGFKIPNAYLVVKKTLGDMRLNPDDNRYCIQSAVTLVAEVKLGPIEFSIAATFHSGSFDIDLVPKSQASDTFGKACDWLASTCADEFKYFAPVLDTLKKILEVTKFEMPRISMTFSTGDAKPVYLRLDFKMTHWDVDFLFSYRWHKGVGGKLKAELWPSSTSISKEKIFHPTWERHLVFLEPESRSPSPAKLFGGDNNLGSFGDSLGKDISHLVIEVDKKAVSLYGRLNLTSVKHKGLSFDSVTFSGKYTFAKPKDFLASFTVSLSLETEPDEAPAYITGTVEHDNGWTLSASINDLPISALGKFFDASSSDDVMQSLGRLRIVSLDISYTFPGDFKSSGVLRLGDLELELEFNHNKTEWLFKAELSATKAESTIGTILDSIVGTAIDLPPFIGNIKVGSGDDKPSGRVITLKCFKNPTTGVVHFNVFLQIGQLKFTFRQYRKLKQLKRVITVSAKLPSLTLPIIGSVDQPFGELLYMWVDTKGNDSQKGLTEADVGIINDTLNKSDHLLFKKTKEKTVISKGSHFVFLDKKTGAVTIDYVFEKSTKTKSKGSPKSSKNGSTKPKNKPMESETSGDAGDAETPGEASDAGPEETRMTPFKKSIGPLTISNIALEYKGKTLAIHLDAEIMMGSVGVSVEDLSVKVDLGNSNLQNLEIKNIDVSIGGLSVSVNQDPITMAGRFQRRVENGDESFEGGLIVGCDPYRFTLAGIYRKSDSDSFKSAFVFGKLEGPLVTLGYADIIAITGGFGYNMKLKLPSVADIDKFPFLMEIDENPMKALKTLTGGEYFESSKGSHWVAAGIKLKAFQALTIDAVVVVQWNPYITLGIYALAIFQIPKTASKKFVHMELGISAVAHFDSGILKLEGQLTQNSYILHTDCHVTGGFAIYYWFPAANEELAHPELDGDWVVTVGGYHPNFQPPAHYPKAPPRLGISWKISNSISIIGEAYFAITPKVCMAGVRLNATYSSGPLKAYFNAQADFLINFDPFHFTAQISVSVGVSYDLDCWLVSTVISVEIDARLYLEGPPFSGRLSVDFYIVSFTIPFGPNPDAVKPVDLIHFYQLVSQSDKVGDGSKTLAAGNKHVLRCESGMINGEPLPESDPENRDKKPDNPADEEWNVRAGSFSFQIVCRFPVNSAKIGSNQPSITLNTPIYAQPMQLQTPLTSEMTIDITKGKVPLSTWKIDKVVKNVPRALWGEYTGNVKSLLKTDDVAIPHIMGIIISAPVSHISVETIPPYKPAEQQPRNAFVFPNKPKPFPTTKEASKCWSPGEPEEDQWDVVSERWKKEINGGKAQEAVREWCTAFSWTSKLTGWAPKRLTKDFGNLYPASPMLSRAE